MAHRLPVVFPFVVLVAALLSLPAFAQDGGVPDGGDVDADGGVEDAGSVDCTPRCDGEILRFCDDDTPVELDCSETGATCEILSEEWGADCVLPEGAECDPGYADGLSRCAGAGDEPEPSNCCVSGVCGDPGEADSCRDFLPGAPERPTTANPFGEEDGASSCLGVGCDNIPLLSLAPLLVGLRLRRRRKG